MLIELIQNHLDTIAKNQLPKLAKALGVSIDEVKKARAQLLELNPKPGNGYSSYNAIPYIRPDLLVVKFMDGFRLIFNDYNQPKIEINSYYREFAKQADTEAARYLNERLKNAEWLISCINQRKTTLMKSVDSIITRQHLFFDRGPGKLVPLTLADVAGDIGLHPSTVSRAIRGKYLQCPWGVFRISEFFPPSLGGAKDAAQTDSSQDATLLEIRHIIRGENPARPKSDQEIADLLARRGIKLARRTVAKYRAHLGLPSAGGRKKF